MSTFLGSWCPQCGSNVSVDEDGCCNSCGCSAVGQGADEAHTTIADLSDRLRIMARVVCDGCGCAPSYDVSREYCLDCWEVRWNYHGINGSGSHVSSSISVGLRALCGRRILEGC